MKIVILDGFILNHGDLSWNSIQNLGECTIYDHTPPEKTIERSAAAQAVFTNKVIISKDN